MKPGDKMVITCIEEDTFDVRVGELHSNGKLFREEALGALASWLFSNHEKPMFCRTDADWKVYRDWIEGKTEEGPNA